MCVAGGRSISTKRKALSTGGRRLLARRAAAGGEADHQAKHRTSGGDTRCAHVDSMPRGGIPATAQQAQRRVSGHGVRDARNVMSYSCAARKWPQQRAVVCSSAPPCACTAATLALRFRSPRPPGAFLFCSAISCPRLTHPLPSLAPLPPNLHTSASPRVHRTRLPLSTTPTPLPSPPPLLRCCRRGLPPLSRACGANLRVHPTLTPTQ